MKKIFPMHVVSDADVLIHLSKLGKLSLLKSLYNEVAIPEHVKSEILIKGNAELQKAFNSFLKVSTMPKDKADDIAKRHNIHIGESLVKALGEELKATLFLSNEKKGKEGCKRGRVCCLWDNRHYFKSSKEWIN
ncbi:MAG: hypothetical protein V3R54_05405 [Thermodesulfovibrionia bacterium]